MKKILTITMSAAILLFFVLAFLVTFKTEAADTNDNTPLATQSTIITQKMIALITKLNKVELGDSFFNDEAYNSLVDNSKIIPDEERGRENPFAPIGN